MNIFVIFFVQPLANGLILFYRLLGENMGLAIIGFTFFLRFILNPLNKPYMESMKKMRDLAPELEKVKVKFKDDKLKLAQAQAELYKQNKVNPGAGCLPYILQIVILIAFFNVFSRTLVVGTDTTTSFNNLLYPQLRFGEGQSINTNFLYFNITHPDTFKIPGISFALPGPLLILAALLQFLTAKISLPYIKIEEGAAKRTSDQTDDMQVSMQKSMIYMFPLMTIMVGMKFASGLALYWLVFSSTQIYQQVRSQGWGELSPFIHKLKLVKSK
jgi:YidC/Oxa1 family membrane protein insertase